MCRRRRVFTSSKTYEISMRVAKGLPFIAAPAMKLLIRSAMARSNRGERIEICHFIWEANHIHLIFVIKDSYEAVKFYMELRRKVCEYIKRLAGVRRLTLWESRPSIMELATVTDVIERIAYIYSNPAKDHLVHTVSKFPGYSSFDYFLTAKNKPLDYSISESTHYIPFDAIEAVGKLAPASALGERMVQKLKRKASFMHTLKITPNAWLSSFGSEGTVATQEEINQINDSVLQSLKIREDSASKERESAGKVPLGVKALKEQPFYLDHTPKDKERRIFVICHDRELRLKIINRVKGITEQCAALYKKACQGIPCEWPPGVFIPPLPPVANAI